jgi:multidrug efflux pump subunit AcrB
MQHLIRLALARPHTVTVGALAVVVLGLLCAASIPIDILPVNRSPAVQVLTFYGGMPAAVVDRTISSRLERNTGQAAGRVRQESRSILGASIIRNYFGHDVDPNNALTQVNSLATACAKSLPPGTDPPVILPFDPTGTTPVCVVALDSPTHSEATLYDVGRYEVRNMIMGLPGANAPAVHGGRMRAILAYIDRHKLEARGLSPLDVVEALDAYNLFLPTGDARFGEIDYAIDSNAMFQAVEDMGDIPLRTESGNATYLRDVARPADSSLMQTSLVRVDGRRQVYIPVYRQVGASTLEVVDRLKSSVGDMTQRLSRDEIDLEVVMDQ